MSSSTSSSKSARRRRSLDEARDLVAAWRTSGESKAAWCRSQGVLCSTLHSCLARIQQREVTGPFLRSPGFIAVHPPRPAEPASGELCLEIGSDVRVLGLDLPGLVAVLGALREGRA
jgi:hypothetical protein